MMMNDIREIIEVHLADGHTFDQLKSALAVFPDCVIEESKTEHGGPKLSLEFPARHGNQIRHELRQAKLAALGSCQ